MAPEKSALLEAKEKSRKWQDRIREVHEEHQAEMIPRTTRTVSRVSVHLGRPSPNRRARRATRKKNRRSSRT